MERLKTNDPAAAAEMLQRGDGAVPHLLEALERRDVDLRLAALEVLKKLVGDGSTSSRTPRRRSGGGSWPCCASSWPARRVDGIA